MGPEDSIESETQWRESLREQTRRIRHEEYAGHFGDFDDREMHEEALFDQGEDLREVMAELGYEEDAEAELTEGLDEVE